jgi:hypothetical protein
VNGVVLRQTDELAIRGCEVATSGSPLSMRRVDSTVDGRRSVALSVGWPADSAAASSRRPGGASTGVLTIDDGDSVILDEGCSWPAKSVPLHCVATNQTTSARLDDKR